MRRYAEQNEIRFKVTDKQKEIFLETASYLYENHLMEKANIQRHYVCKMYRYSVIESKIMKQQQQRQKQMQQPTALSYPPYYTGEPTQPF